MKSVLIDKRIKELEKELAAVHGSIRTLVKHPPKVQSAELAKADEFETNIAVAELPTRRILAANPNLVSHAPPPRPPALAPIPRPDVAAAGSAMRGRDERFVDYLASSLGPAQPLRRERNAERNRALVAIAFALLLLFWIVSRLLFL